MTTDTGRATVRVSRVRPEAHGAHGSSLAGTMSQSQLAHSPEWAT